MVAFNPLHGSFGAEVTGVPPTLEMDDATFRAVEQAWYRHSILLFRNLTITPAQHIAFTRRFGPLHIMEPLDMNLPGHPEIFVVSNAIENGRPIGLKRAGEGYHTDGEDKRIPNAGSMLYAIELPPERGDTIFVDMYAVLDAVPADIRRKLEGRRARYSRVDLHHIHYPLMDPLTEAQKQARPDVFHPLLRRHPGSGRTSLYIGRWACDIEGMDPAEGRAIILGLQALAQERRFEYRHKWRVADAILWDNRCTQHCAAGFDDDRHIRTMYRTTIEGELPEMATAA